MGNCQAIDNASLVIQHTNGKVERLYAAVSAAEVMKLNPGHYVALLLTTTLYSSRPPASTATAAAATKQNNPVTTHARPLRITRIKLLRPTENLTVGHIYRFITTQEVMKGLMAKNGKVNDYMNKPVPVPAGELGGTNVTAAVRSNQSERTHHQMKRSEKDRRTAAAMKPKGWHPSLNTKVVVELAKDGEIQFAALLHPSFVTLDDIKGVKVPTGILGAEIDKISPSELVKEFEAALVANEVNNFAKIYPGVSHGWTIRYKDEDAAEVKCAQEAHQDLVEWFGKCL